MLGIKNTNSKVTEDEIKLIINEGTKGGEVQQVEQDIMERVFLLGDLKVNSIMTQRNDLIWLNSAMSKEQVLQVINEHLFDMYPVFEGNKDSVEGVIFLKDLIIYLNDDKFNLKNIVRPAPYFYETTSVYKMLEQMKKQQTGRALVCDEFGVCQGIITLRDILGALVGILDENKTECDVIQRSDGKSWLVDGQYPFYDLLFYFEKDVEYDYSRYNTLGGLILENLEHIPKAGEYVIWNSFRFEVMDMDGARIDKVLVTFID